MKKELGEKIVEQIFHDDHEDYMLIERGEWIDEGKVQYCNSIFKDPDETYWQVSASKSGSYFSDYEYMYDSDITEVEQKEVTVTKWVAVKDEKTSL